MSRTDEIFKGMKLIKKYTDDEEWNNYTFQSEHDQIWCCKYNGDEMTEKEKEDMESWGWFEDEDSWSIFT